MVFHRISLIRVICLLVTVVPEGTCANKLAKLKFIGNSRQLLVQNLPKYCNPSLVDKVNFVVGKEYLASVNQITVPREDKRKPQVFSLLHELGHIYYKDVIGEMSITGVGLLGTMATMAYGPLSGITGVCVTGGIGLGLSYTTLRYYSYWGELRADSFAIDGLKINKNIKGLLSEVVAMKHEAKFDIKPVIDLPILRPMFMTHPPSQERAKRAEQALRELEEA